MAQSPAWPGPQPDRYHAGEPRARAAIAAVAIEAALIVAIVLGLAGPVAILPPTSASLISIALDPPPKPKERLKASGATANGRAAPPSLKAEAAPVVAPLRVIVPPPRPVLAAKLPAASVGVQAGVATQPGAGGGAGGQGTGSGSGNGGTGTGDGNGDGTGGGSDPDWVGGKIRDKDYPKALREANISGTTVTDIAVGIAGRATGCRVTRSSGNRELDSTTCRLVMERFKFKPARNAAGQAVPAQIEYEQEWDAPPPPPPDPGER